MQWVPCNDELHEDSHNAMYKYNVFVFLETMSTWDDSVRLDPAAPIDSASDD